LKTLLRGRREWLSLRGVSRNIQDSLWKKRPDFSPVEIFKMKGGRTRAKPREKKKLSIKN